MSGISASDKALLWKAGRISAFKLHGGQKKLNDHYRTWEKQSLAQRLSKQEIPGLWPRVYVAKCSRRFGKDYWGTTLRIEDCLRNPGSKYTYGTAHFKDIADIIVPMFEDITSDCPTSLKPYYTNSYKGGASGFRFHNGSFLKLVGIDLNPNGLRGRDCAGYMISEAAYVDKLKDTVLSVLMPMLQDRIDASIILNSNPSADPGHSFKEFCADAIDRDAYKMFTIFDNPRLDDSTRKEFIQAAGGLQHERCRREYLCEDIRGEEMTVVPEFDSARHVRAFQIPEYALGYSVVDPGVRDMTGIVCGYYDFERAKLCIVSDWAKRGAPTNEVAMALTQCEHTAFGQLKFWNKDHFQDNPFQRFSDTEARLILDLNVQHGIKIGPVDKDGAEAALNSLRNAFQLDKIEIHPNAKRTIQHVENAIWNKGRTSYDRSDVYGHFDLLDCLKYMWRMTNRSISPMPPAGVRLAQQVNIGDLMYRPEHMRSGRRAAEVLSSILPSRWRTAGRK